MPRLIKLESVAQEPPVEILQVDSGSLTIGREPENHIVIDSDSVSRQHGSLFEAHGNWLYRDLQSTNGSWVNGVRLSAGQTRLLRSGDVVQLADFPMRLTYLDEAKDSAGLLLVFGDGNFLSAYSLGNNEPPFTIGGANPVYSIDGAPTHQEQIRIALNKGRLELTAGVSEFSVVVNGMACSGLNVLSDRDEVAVGPFQIFVSDAGSARPAARQAQQPGAGGSPMYGGAQAYERPNVPQHLRRPNQDEWESEAARRRTTQGRRFVFGTDPEPDEVNSTLGVSRESFSGTSGFEMSASQRFSQAVAEAEEAPSQLGENVLIAFGIFIFCLIVGFLVYFFLMT